MRTVTIATASAMLIGSCFASSASLAAQGISKEACGTDTRMAIAAARGALQSGNSKDDRTALVCLVEAVAALEGRLQGLASGDMPFEGQIYAPKGVVMVKPSDQERR